MNDHCIHKVIKINIFINVFEKKREDILNKTKQKFVGFREGTNLGKC